MSEQEVYICSAGETFQPLTVGSWVSELSGGLIPVKTHRPSISPIWPESDRGRGRDAGQRTAVDWVLRLVAVNRGRKQDEVFSWASGKAIEIPSCGNLRCSCNSSVMALSKSVLMRIIPSSPFLHPKVLLWQADVKNARDTFNCSVSDAQLFMIVLSA